MKRTKYTPNNVVDCGNFYEMYLYDAFGRYVSKTKIDKDDLNKIIKYKWYQDKRKGYVVCGNKNNRTSLQKFIMETPGGSVTDHINGDVLDNRKQNLRICTNQQNLFNRRNAKGHYWNKEKKKWEVRLMLDRKSIFLGYFTNKQIALDVRKGAEEKYFGEFAPQF